MINMVTKTEAKRMRDHYSSLLEKLLDAKIKLLEGGAKSYTIGDLTLTRFDLSTLSDEIEKAEKKRNEYDAVLNGQKPRKIVGIVPKH